MVSGNGKGEILGNFVFPYFLSFQTDTKLKKEERNRFVPFERFSELEVG